MDILKLNKLDLYKVYLYKYLLICLVCECYQGVMTSFDGIQTESAAHKPCEPLRVLVLWHIYSGEDFNFYQQKNFMFILISSFPNDTELIVNTIGPVTTNILNITKYGTDSTWVKTLAVYKPNQSADTNIISWSLINETVNAELNRGGTSTKAEVVLFVVNDESEFDNEEDVVTAMKKKKKKTYVVLTRMRPPSEVLPNLATDTHHLLRLGDSTGEDVDAFLKLACQDSRLYCNTNQYWTGSRCEECTYICSMITKTLSSACRLKCPYLNRPKQLHGPTSGPPDQNAPDVLLWDQKSFIISFAFLCILVTIGGMIVALFLICYCNMTSEKRGETTEHNTSTMHAALAYDTIPLQEQGHQNDSGSEEGISENGAGDDSSDEVMAASGSNDLPIVFDFCNTQEIDANGLTFNAESPLVDVHGDRNWTITTV